MYLDFYASSFTTGITIGHSVKRLALSMRRNLLVFGIEPRPQCAFKISRDLRYHIYNWM